jgi:hypothetical protein
MVSYDIVSVYRSPRHDSFNRELARDLSRSDAEDLMGMAANGNSGNTDKMDELPSNWMRRRLARVRRQST